MAGVEARREPLEEDVADEVRRGEADEGLGEPGPVPFVFLALPRVPAPREDAPERGGADRDAERSVLREVPGRVEGDEEAA